MEMMLFFYFFVVVFFLSRVKLNSISTLEKREKSLRQKKKKSIFMKDLKLHPLVESLQDTGQDRDN